MPKKIFTLKATSFIVISIRLIILKLILLTVCLVNHAICKSVYMVKCARQVWRMFHSTRHIAKLNYYLILTQFLSFCKYLYFSNVNISQTVRNKDNITIVFK